VLRDVTHEAEVNRLKSESISMAAHELRTPLTTITSYVDVLMQGVVGPANEAQQEFLQVIRTNASRLMTLVTGLLDVAKIESQGLTLNLRPVSMIAVVNEAVKTLKKQIDDKQQVLTVDVPAHLPQVMADREWMVQVVTNLVSNANKYSPPGGQVAIRGRVADDQFRLEVQDSGIGISPKDQKLVFTRFFRADNALVAQEGGTGLGLAICREIVVRHGGKVQVDSELGKGSTFSILLPLAG
jgi:signal transduction histidine kinase